MTTNVQPRRLEGDGGAVIIEAALLVPLLLVFFAGIVDYGIGFRNRTVIQSATRNGARVGASSVSQPSADKLALSTFYAGLASTHRVTVQKAIIFEANSTSDGEPTTTCKNIAPQSTGAGNSAANCNVYGLSQIQAAAGVSGTFVGATTVLIGSTVSSNCTDGWNRYWCAGGAASANERTANLAGTMDSLGLYVQLAYSPFTGVFGGDDLIITDSVVMRLEPTPG